MITAQIKKCKILIVFDHMTAGMFSNKQIQPIKKKQFIRFGKIYISLVFITHLYFAVRQLN